MMDWIEEIFHVSPDGGNGALELLFAVAPVAAIVAGLLWVLHRRKKSRNDS
jgi:heme/copper-type cytochrome/quinol oxidase subunit 4